MENKKNLPYIPLYTGDWEKDCNVLSLEAEAAWLRIIFKMFNNGKQSSYKISTKALQNLWRVPEDKMVSIIHELEDNEICGIAREERFFIFTSRRYERENAISEIRREAVSKRKDRTNDIQTSYKTDTKNTQNTEYESEYEYESEDVIVIELKGGMGEKNEVYPFDVFWNDYDKKVGKKDKLIQKWKKLSDSDKLKIKEYIPKYKSSEPDKQFRKNPETFLNNQSWNDEIIIKNGKRNSEKQSGITDDYKQSILARLQTG